MAISQYLHETLRTLAFGSITTSFVAVGSAMEHSILKYKLINGTDEALTISFDGINDHERILSNTAYVEDVALESISTVELPKGTTIYVKHDAGSGPTVGNVYVSVTYSSNYSA